MLSACGLLSWNDKPVKHSSHGSSSSSSSSATHRSSRPATPSKPAETDYTVRPGDTLYSIAFRNQLDYHDLANWNDIGRDYAISVGQTLRLTPPGSPLLAAAPDAPATPAPASGASAAAGRRAPPPTTTPTLPDLPSVRPSDESPIGDWRWPTLGELVHRYDPDGGQKGIDIGGQPGQPVVAAAAGKVVYSGSALKGYGELVILKHNERYLSAYGYNRRRLVEEGQQVAAGQPIAELGNGPTQQPMLHFEIRDKGVPVNPLPLLPGH